MAEVIARNEALKQGIAWCTFSSAGINAQPPGGVATDGALKACAKRGLTLTSHRSRQLTDAMVASASLILTMSRTHLTHVQGMAGGQRPASMLTTYASEQHVGTDVVDPIGQPDSVYETTEMQLEREISHVLQRIQQEHGAPHQ
jgi:protein-tyrosine-phosphatase